MLRWKQFHTDQSMPWLPHLLSNRFRLPDVHSIRFRLTAGVVLASALAIGGISGWLNWRLRHILLASHQTAIATLSQRFEEDVALYDEMMPTVAAVQKVIDLRAIGDTAIWVKSEDDQIWARSETLSMGSWQADGLTEALQALPVQKQQTMMTVGDRTLAVCISPLTVDQQSLGSLFVVEDITQDRQTYVTMTRNLVITSGLTLLVLATVIGLYVWRSLQPIKALSTEVMGVTADSLNATRLQLDQAPTEVKEFAAALDHTLERLSQSWEQQRQLVGDMSHELRTPLTLVQGYLQSTLRRCHTLTAPQREGLETAASETERTIQILNDLLILARASMGHPYLPGERIDLKAVVLEAIARADRTGDRIEAEIRDSPLWIRVDVNALRQVLINLLDNALNYSRPETTVTVVLFVQGQQAVVQVCDRGRGIPLAETLITKMQGTVSVQSSLGEGSTFTVRLPLYPGV